MLIPGSADSLAMVVALAALLLGLWINLALADRKWRFELFAFDLSFGAVLAAVVLLLRRRPSLSPYVMIGYQALIKIMLGAALAVVGILALGAGVTSGLIGIPSAAALLLWAVIFGYAQQIGTRLLDKYTDEVLDQARPLPEAPDGPRVAPR